MQLAYQQPYQRPGCWITVEQLLPGADAVKHHSNSYVSTFHTSWRYLGVSLQGFIAIMLLAISASWARAQTAEMCGDPPPVADETIKGDLRGEAQLLSRYLGKAELGGQFETSRREIFSRYRNIDERSEAYFEYQVCILIMNDDELSNHEKINELRKIRREKKSSEPMSDSNEYTSISSRKFRLGPVEIFSITLSPQPPAYIGDGQEVTATFNYRVARNSQARIWITPVLDEFDGVDCELFGPSSSLYVGSGTEQSAFRFQGTNCDHYQVEQLEISIKEERYGMRERVRFNVLYVVVN